MKLLMWSQWSLLLKLDAERAKCNICQKDYKTPQGNTSNIRDHIILKHGKTKEGIELKELTDKKKKAAAQMKAEKEKGKEKRSITNYLSSDKQVSVRTKETIDDSVVEFIITCNESFSKVENPFFRRMCFRLNSGYTLFSRRELGRKVDKKIENLKAALTKEIQDDIKSHNSIHITSDGGNSGDQNKTKKNTLTVSRITDDFRDENRHCGPG